MTSQSESYSLSKYRGSNENQAIKYPMPELNVIDINLTQLQRNINIIRGIIKPEVKLLAVLKGDAYGHGLVTIASELERCKCDAFGVVRLNEAFALREAGIKTPILVMAPISPKQVPWAVKNNITLMVDHEEILKPIIATCNQSNRTMSIHVKVNTGLNRFGVAPEKAAEFLLKIKKEYPQIIVEGIYTHFQNADYDHDFTKGQIKRFDDVIKQLEDAKLRPPIAHAANSAGILNYPEAHYNMVRCGTLLFCLEHKKGDKIFPKGVKPLMTFKTRITKIRIIEADEYGGYGDSFIAQRDTKVAVVAAGYGDGISRGWKEVLIAGRCVPILNYFMDAVLVDLTDIKEEVQEFDEVVIIGHQENEQISWADACQLIGTYQDEQLQYVTDRVTKRYFYE